MEDCHGRQNIVIGQQVSEEKRRLAWQMRREMTPQEKMLWQQLRGSRLGVNFRRQQNIDGFIADFYCHNAGLVVEVDGAVHDAAYDAERDAILATRGLSILRFTNSQVETDIGLVASQIRRHLAQTGHGE